MPGGSGTPPVREVCLHTVCGTETRMARALAETYSPGSLGNGSTYCMSCGLHRPVGVGGEFVWLDGSEVGT